MQDRPEASTDGMTGRPTGEGAASDDRSYARADVAQGSAAMSSEVMTVATDDTARRRRGTRRMRSG